MGSVWWQVAAGALAFASAACAACALADRFERAKMIREAQAEGTSKEANRDVRFDDRLIAYAESTSRALSLGVIEAAFRVRGGSESHWFSKHAKKAGVAEQVTQDGYREACRRMTLVGLLAGAVAGAALSVELAVLLAVSGAVLGRIALPWAVVQQEKRRAEELERRLSEMLEVVALGLRSGLSFDRGLRLYAEHFDSLLARSCASAQRQWSLGLRTREEALRNLADSYSSPLFGRVVDSVVRSLRFGASLADDLESAAGEARAAYRSIKQEQVAKAPVKMMVPTGALMLPAMLLLVMGPVLLELMEGF